MPATLTLWPDRHTLRIRAVNSAADTVQLYIDAPGEMLDVRFLAPAADLLNMLQKAAEAVTNVAIAAERAEPTRDRLPIYRTWYPVVDGVETVTNRLACCGAGPDRLDPRTTERLHLPGCAALAGDGLAACRRALIEGRR